MILYFHGTEGITRGFLLIGFIALVIGGTTTIYNVDHWSLTKQNMIHFLVIITTVFPILLNSGWFLNELISDGLRILGIFTTSGLVIWTIMFTLAKIFKW